MSTSPIQTSNIQEILLSWYQINKRDLPWRSVYTGNDKSLLRDPYRVLVSELMLQQTQVPRVIEKFHAFMSKWPTIQDLARAPLSEVLVMWKGLGYNRRARFLWETAKQVTDVYRGVFPNDEVALQTLPGIGPYTRSALLVFAFGEQVTVIDTNIRRILTRVFHGLTPLSEKEVGLLATRVLPIGYADDWHQGLMDFGSSICLAEPKCEICPLQSHCEAYNQAQQQNYLSVAAWLTDHRVQKTRRGKDAGKVFKETDRYLRGRIIDFLRDGECPMQSLQQHIVTKHDMGDLVRFGNVIEGLVQDKLISIQGNRVRLG